jgi:hypothetical protein
MLYLCLSSSLCSNQGCERAGKFLARPGPGLFNFLLFFMKRNETYKKFNIENHILWIKVLYDSKLKVHLCSYKILIEKNAEDQKSSLLFIQFFFPIGNVKSSIIVYK